MFKLSIFFISIICCGIIGYAQEDCNTQIEYLEVNSEILGTTRQLKLQKPRNYNPESKKTYPLLFVFDADYLFEPVAGTTDYLSYWEEIPEAFVVGVNQDKTRLDDGEYDKEDFLPTESGARFFDFIQIEVLPFLRENFKLGNFSVAIGHDLMGNFINLFLFTDRSDFQGFINLSPDIPNGLMPYIKDKLQNSKEKLWYNIATGTDDLKFIQDKTKVLYESLSTIENDNINVSYKLFENTNHYTLVSYALPYCLESIFEPYSTINVDDFASKIANSENPLVILEEKYKLIDKLYDIKTKVRLKDIISVYQAIEKEQNWEFCKGLANVVKKEYPETLLYNFFMGKYFQGIGKPKKAYKAYKSGYIYEEAAGITKDMLIDEADVLKEAFGL